MLKTLFNECHFTLTITPEDPILVKSGQATISGPDMTPVQTWRHGKPEVFLPGSSLKGVFRSHLERVIRTIKEGIVCIPYLDVKREQSGISKDDYQDVFCGNKFRLREGRPRNETITNEIAYRDSCPACRLFGSTEFIGRMMIGDAYLTPDAPVSLERRDGVGIDRFTGGAAHRAKFELEVVAQGTFETTVHLKNFEIWQLGMLAIVMRDLQENLIQIGSGKSRGLGRVHGAFRDVKIAFFRSAQAEQMPLNEIWGLGKFLGNAQYGTDAEDILDLDDLVERGTNGIRLELPLQGALLDRVLDQATTAFIRKMQAWPVPKGMTYAYLSEKEGGKTS